MRRASRKDANQNSIARTVEELGGAFIDLTDSANAGFDGLIVIGGRVFIAEVKDGAKPPSARKLTDNEQRRRAQLEGLGITYNVIETHEDVLRLRENALGIQ
jgi:hypothetical protein